MADSNSSALTDAANLITTTETTALTSLAAIITDTVAKIAAVTSTLSYPASFPADSVRIAASLTMNLQWPSQEIAQKIAALNPPVTPVTPTSSS